MPDEDEPEDEDELVFLPTHWVYALEEGGYYLAMPDAFLALIAEHIGALRTALMSDADDPKLRPLFPTAYNEDPELDAEYQRLMRSELLSSRLAAFDTVEQTMQKDVLTESELYQWMQSINAVRLAIAERNGFNLEEDDDPDPDDPRYYEFEVLELFGLLMSEIVHALRAGSSVDDAGRSD